MRVFLLISVFFFTLLDTSAQYKKAEDYYEEAYREIIRMLNGTDSLSIKRAVFISEWAYYEGKLKYDTDFCNEINRITDFINLFYKVNQLEKYKTGKQMALNEYFFRPYSGNHYKPYDYDMSNFSSEDENWENQFVSKVLKTHKGQCRSLPWMYKILSKEIGADVF